MTKRRYLKRRKNRWSALVCGHRWHLVCSHIPRYYYSPFAGTLNLHKECSSDSDEPNFSYIVPSNSAGLLATALQQYHMHHLWQ